MTIISTPEELLTAIPFLLDDKPEESLIIVALAEGVVDTVLQSPLPTENSLSITAEPFRTLSQTSVDQLLVLAYLPGTLADTFDDLRWREVQALCEKIASVKDFLLVAGGRWRSYLCKDDGCCDPSGTPIPDIASSEIAAEHVFQGRLMPDSLRINLAKDEELLTLITQAQSASDQCAPADRSRRGVVALLRLISDFTITRELSHQRLIADALVALTDIQVRDFAIGSHGDENLELHANLWSELLVVAPPGFQAPVATLLALLRYESGDAVSAKAALEQALSDNPHYSLAHLLQKTFSAGWPPEAFTTMRHELHPKLRAELLG